MELDRISARLLALVQEDARTPVSELARALGRAETTTRDRLISLEKRGFITGYQAIVDPTKLGYKVRVLLRADAEPARTRELAKQLFAIPNVVRAFVTTGPKPIRIELATQDFDELERVLSKRIAPLNLRDLEIGLVVQTLLDQRPIPLPGGGLLETDPEPATVPLEEPDTVPLVAVPAAKPLA